MVTSPAITNVSAQSVATAETSVVSSDSYDNGNSATSQMVASGRSLSSGDSSEDRSSLPHHIYRRQPVGLGSSCGTRGTSVSWSMDRRPIPAPHQCAGDESNFSLSITSSSQGKELHCVGVNGQHHSGSLHKASGRDSFHRTHRRSVERPELVLSPQHTSVSEAHTGQVQHSSRPDVPSRQTDLYRVVPESGNIFQIMDFPSIDLFATGLNHRLPIYVSPIPDQKALSIDALSMDWNRIHAYAFPPFHLIPAVINKIRLFQCKIVLIAPLWPDRPWFSRAPRSVGVTTGISASNSKPASSAKRQNSASKPGPSTASRLGIVKQSLRDKQFSSEVAEHVSKARRVSTAKVYDAKWQIFCDWANQR